MKLSLPLSLLTYMPLPFPEPLKVNAISTELHAADQVECLDADDPVTLCAVSLYGRISMVN